MGSSYQTSKLLFRQLFDKESSTYTYLLVDASQPQSWLTQWKTMERDLSLFKDLGLKLIYAINTHVHADHVTGTGLLKSKVPGVKSVISKASNAKADLLVEPDGKIFFVDLFLEVKLLLCCENIDNYGRVRGLKIDQNLSIQVCGTPGHTVGCVTYVTGDGPNQPQPRMAFTGDVLLIRGCGRTDFQGGSSELLYNSVHSQETFKNIMENSNLPYPKMIDVANMVCGLQV